MRFVSLVPLASFLLAQRVCAQALDIGGVQLRLGQTVASALSALGIYDVRYSDQGKTWFVSQRDGTKTEVVGLLSATNGLVSFISKSYRMSSDFDAQRAYTLASKDLRDFGGPLCATREVEFADKQVHAFETRCGTYILTYYLPSTYDGKNISGSAAIEVRALR